MESPIVWTSGKTLSARTGLNMAWEAAGPDDAPCILMIAGLGCQLTMWHDAFCAPLLKLGYRLIRFDNRDMGLTDEHPSNIPMNVPLTYLRNKIGLLTPTNYTLDLMADDALGLIDALQLKQPHVLGISMGGMIAQIMAAKAPNQIGKLILLMSSTNHPRLPMPNLNVMLNMFLKIPQSTAMEDVVKHVERVLQVIGSPAYPTPQKIIRERTIKAYLRAYRPAGALRQTHCIVATGSIEDYTPKITALTCIIHGLNDPLLKKACALRMAKLIHNSKLHLIKGLGHDLPEALSNTFGEMIHQHLSE